MKKILSALTALCMCASMTTGVLPASALNALTPVDTVIAAANDTSAHDKGYEWDIADVEYTFKDLATDEVDLDINVYNDPGTYGVQFKILIDGKDFSDPGCPFELYDVVDGGGYSKIGTLQPNCF